MLRVLTWILAKAPKAGGRSDHFPAGIWVHEDVSEDAMRGKTGTLESMVGFVGFQRLEHASCEEGLLKITESKRPDGSGYLTLTFILDAEGETLRGRQLAVLDETDLRATLGPRFEMAMDLPLRGREPESSHWIEEMDLFFRPLDPFPLPFVSEILLPVLEKQLRLKFDVLSDWAEHPVVVVTPSSIWTRLARWLRLA